MDIEITRPRTGRQTHGYNVTAGSTEELFRRTIYIPFLENITSNLEGWFGDLQRKLMKITCLLNPTFQDLAEDVYDILKKFSSKLPKLR